MARDTQELGSSTETRLTYVNDDDPGVTRQATAKGFVYKAPDGRRITNPVDLERIAALAIPPAWTQVWICPHPHGHIQATGRDQKGRKQYRYHVGWREARDAAKYDRMLAFGRALPRLRRRVDADLVRRGLPREKVLAAVVRIMELTLIRVGNEEYARTNRSFGLTTLRDRHARISAAGAVFEFRGKSGKVHSTGLRDRRLARIIKACQDIPGQRLFQYMDAQGQRRAVESADVNAYIRTATGGDFSAKDFRTWAGTLHAAQALMNEPAAQSPTEARRRTTACIRLVAARLGNTVAVCRSSYIHPRVLAAYEAGELPSRPKGAARAFELQVLKFLDTARICEASNLE